MAAQNETIKAGIADAEFLRRLDALNGNRSALARELGVSHTSVAKRIKRIKKAVRETGAKTGETAALVLMGEEARQGFPDGIARANGKVSSLERMGRLLSLVEQQVAGLEDILRDEAAKGKTRIFKPHLNKGLVLLVREARGLLTDAAKIKADLFSVRSTETFMSSVIRVMEKYDPDVQRKIYSELQKASREEQILGLGDMH